MRVRVTGAAALLAIVAAISPHLGASRADERAIAIETPLAAPDWALAERALLRANGDGVAAYAARFLDARGYMPVEPHWGVSDGPDDLTENVRNWPLAHMLGGPDSILDDWQRLWTGHLDQFTHARIPEVEAARDGIYHNEFITAFDWEHNSEWLGPFYYYSLSRPGDVTHVARARKYAGLYMNEDPGAPNFDPRTGIIRSLFNGSRGPKLTPATANDWDGPAEPGTDPASPRRTRFKNATNIKGDHPLNLNVAHLVFNAYVLTGDEKYRDWVIRYVDTWRRYADANGGNIPSNIGLDGRIGGEWNGKWYGGVFGWNSPDEGVRNYVLRGTPEAFFSAFLLTGDRVYPQVLHRQIDNLFAAQQTKDGERLLPRYYGDQGWYGFHPLTGGPSGALGNLPNVLVDLYLWSLSADDLARIPAAGTARQRHHPDFGWIDFLRTGNERYAIEALTAGLDEIRRTGLRLAGQAPAAGRGRGDGATPGAPARGRGGAGPQGPPITANPVATTALINLTMGASDPGGSTHGPMPINAQVRHFDPEKHRAGLPDEVAALVRRIDSSGVTLTLVNTNPLQPRTVVVQGGAYAEHQVSSVTVGGRTTRVGASAFTVRLAPGAGDTITIALRRFVNRPTAAFPWDRPGASR
jgi:hypothetical protein